MGTGPALPGFESKRPDFEFPSKETYNDFRAGGNWLKAVMAQPGAAKTERKDSTGWDAWTSIEKWGWRKVHQDQLYYRTVSGLGDLVGSSRGNEYVWNHNHNHTEDEYVPKGVEYPATNALYANVFFPDKGVILAEVNESPQYKVIMDQTEKGKEWDEKIHRTPDLCRWSDIVYLTWKHVCGGDREKLKNLNAIVRQNITNPVTKNILAHALRQNFPKDEPVGRAPEWPQTRKITPNTEGFNAMLNTPNIRGIVWLLVQHREEGKFNGHKIITSLTTYTATNSSGYFPNIIVEIEDVKKEVVAVEPKDEAKEKQKQKHK